MNYTIAQTLPDKQFKRRFGVHKNTFKLMVNTLKPYWRAVPKPGAKPKIGLEDRVLVALEYWREYRTYFHIGTLTFTLARIGKSVSQRFAGLYIGWRRP